MASLTPHESILPWESAKSLDGAAKTAFFRLYKVKMVIPMDILFGALEKARKNRGF